MSQALYRKWRPRLWDQVVGQEHITQTLRNAVRSERIGHAYLFAGPRGTGKTTTARLLAKAVNCLNEDPASRPCDACAHCIAVNENRFMDLIEIDAASNTSVDDVRDLRDKINFAPSQGRFKVYIIDEVHMLSTAAFNALLKTLEEPPAHVKFILATTEIHKIPATVLSRCQRHEFRRVPVGEIARLLRDNCVGEGLSIEEDALMLIARQATGSLRDAISLLDQLTSTGNKVTLAEAQVVLGTATSEAVIRLIEAVLARDAAAGMQVIQTALDSGSDPRQFSRQVVDYLRGLLLVRMNNAGLLDVTPETRAQMAAQAARLETPRLLEVIRLFNAAASDSRSSWQPGLGLELALAEAVEERVVVEQPVYEQRAAPQAARPSAPPSREEPNRRPEPVYETHSPAAPSAPDTRRAAPPAARPSDPAPGASKASQPSPPQAGASTGGQGDINTSWVRIKEEVKKRSGLTAAALNSHKNHNIVNGVLILEYQNDLLKKKMETEENLAMLREAIQVVTGISIQARCIVVGTKSSVESEDLDAEGEGIVRTALGMGGKIVHKGRA